MHRPRIASPALSNPSARAELGSMRSVTHSAIVLLILACGCQPGASVPAEKTGRSHDAQQPSGIVSPGPHLPSAGAVTPPTEIRPAQARSPKRLPQPELASTEFAVPLQWRWLYEVHREHPTQELISLIQQALPSTESKSAPITVVFPVVDETNTIRVDGAVLGLMANYLLTSVDEVRQQVSPAEWMAVLIEANCWQAGTVVDQQAMNL
jgi:hypothetical protein